jgi:hypothetical protein
MIGEQSRKFKVGNRVCWQKDPADQGTVTETNWAGVTIKWDNRSKQESFHNDSIDLLAALKRTLDFLNKKIDDR